MAGEGGRMAGCVNCERIIDAHSDAVYGNRVEPKVTLSNERTFLEWISMSVTLGSIASVRADARPRARPWSPRIARCRIAPVSRLCVLLLYASDHRRPAAGRFL